MPENDKRSVAGTGPETRRRRPAELTVVLVSRDSASWLPACLASLRESTLYPSSEVLVVDNASTDGGPSLVRERFPEVTVLVNPTNLGYSRAVNQGWRRGVGKYLLILNPDVVVRPSALEVLHGYLESHGDVGLVAPRLINLDGSIQHSCRRHYTLGTYLLRRTPLGRILPDHPILRRHLMADWDHADVRDVDWVLGAAMMMRREAVGDTALDERYFLYFEDVDLCLRLRNGGWRVVYHPGAEMMHHHRRASAEGIWSRQGYEHARSWLKFLRKHGLRVPDGPSRR